MSFIRHKAAINIYGLVLVMLCLPLASPVAAFDMSPDSGTIATSSTQQLHLVAKPPTGNWNGVDVRMTLSGQMTITDITFDNDLTTSAPCGTELIYTANSICVTLVQSGAFTTDQFLATVTVEADSSTGSASFDVEADADYFNPLEESVISTGTIATYTIGAETIIDDPVSNDSNSTLPNTGIFFEDEVEHRIMLGGLMILAGFIAFRLFREWDKYQLYLDQLNTQRFERILAQDE